MSTERRFTVTSAYDISRITPESPHVLQTLRSFWQDYYPKLSLLQEQSDVLPNNLEPLLSQASLENLFGLLQLREELKDMRESGSVHKKSLSKRGKREAAFHALDLEEVLTVTFTNRSKEKAVVICYHHFLSGSKNESVKIAYMHQDATAYTLEFDTFADESYELRASDSFLQRTTQFKRYREGAS